MAQNADMEAPGIQKQAIQLQLFRKDMEGAWEMRNPKLYWHEVLSESYFTNCDQEELYRFEDVIGEVVLLNFPRYREQVLLGNNFEEFIEKITSKKGPGRPTLYPGEKSVEIRFLLPESLVKKMGEDPNEKAREMLIEKLGE
jgi:hypothetical protein